jgi:hypothetical protein
MGVGVREIQKNVLADSFYSTLDYIFPLYRKVYLKAVFILAFH